MKGAAKPPPLPTRDGGEMRVLRISKITMGEQDKTSLIPLRAVVERSHSLRCEVACRMGGDMMYSAACDRIQYHPEGITVSDGCVEADVVLCYEDSGDKQEFPWAKAVFRRSATPEQAGDGRWVYPAWGWRNYGHRIVPMPPFGEKPVVSFCGVAHRPQSRVGLIAKFAESDDIDFRLLEREKFSDPDISRRFLKTLYESHYVLCPAGVGRYSHRFYETLDAGRIPVMDKAHCLPRLPGAHYIPASDTSVQDVLAHYTELKKRPLKMMAENHNTWTRLCSPFGWLCTFADTLLGEAPHDS